MMNSVLLPLLLCLAAPISPPLLIPLPRPPESQQSLKYLSLQEALAPLQSCDTSYTVPHSYLVRLRPYYSLAQHCLTTGSCPDNDYVQRDLWDNPMAYSRKYVSDAMLLRIRSNKGGHEIWCNQWAPTLRENAPKKRLAPVSCPAPAEINRASRVHGALP
jgi:hypothetical protein